MGEFLRKKSIGFYIMAVAAVAAIVSIVRFLLWAPSNNTMDIWVLLPLIAGLVLNLILLVKDSDYLMILTTICYGFSVMKLLSNSVGSFVDAFQGINMFGDATQVNTIISISIVLGVCVLLTIAACFMKRVKDS